MLTFATLRACVAVLVPAGLVFAAPPARADQGLQGHLPIVSASVTTSFSTTANSYGVLGDTFSPNGSLSNGSWQITGTFTIPIAGGLSASYDKLDPALLNASLQAVALPAGAPVPYAYPGSSRDLYQRYHLDKHIAHWNFEAGFASRTRLCCPASNDPSNSNSFEWHQGYLTATYLSSPIRALGRTTLVLSLTGLTANHNPSAADLAAMPPGLGRGAKRWYATNQAVSALIPLGVRGRGATLAGTFIWGAFDTYENAAFPWYYDTYIVSLNKQFSPVFGLSLRDEVGIQRIQGDPEPGPNVIRASTIVLGANFHFDFNSLVRPKSAGAR